MGKFFARLLPQLLLLLLFQTSVGAQEAHRPHFALGDAVVTGFSGTRGPEANGQRSTDKTAIDLTFIDPDGPSARIMHISRPETAWNGQLLKSMPTFDILAKDVGQVFGVALDDQPVPNIYLAATSAYGLYLVRPGRDGAPERRKKGGPRTVWMNGQFGLDLQGDPGSIYRIDGTTGMATLFAKVTLGGVPNPGPALGNLAYDPATKQLFVSDLYTGMIHRFDLDGKDLGHYDHGVTGRSAAKLPPVAFDPTNRPDISSARFDTEDPDSWGFAPPERRVWGLAVHDGRLYYAVMAGPQIWSVGIQPDGSFADDPRWELDVAKDSGPYQVSDIAFSKDGAMILAQRAPIAASYDYTHFTQPGEPRVLRYRLKGPDDPPSPGRWIATPDEYAVGFTDNYRNTDGGVALGYGYAPEGTLSETSCDAALWTTMQDLHDIPSQQGDVGAGELPLVLGLQGSPADLVRPKNTPPTMSYFVNYDDKFDPRGALGHMGSVRVFSHPCGAPAHAAEEEFGVEGGGCVGPNCPPVICYPTCVCPPRTALVDGRCRPVKRCPPPQVINPRGICVCPDGTALQDGRCVKIVFNCPPGSTQENGRCGPPSSRECQPPFVPGPMRGTCVCPSGTVSQDGRCAPQICQRPLVPGPCVCPPGMVWNHGLCVPGPHCPPPQVPNKEGVCACPPPMVRGATAETCVCPRRTVLKDGECVPSIICRGSMVPNDAGTACVCRPGWVQHGRSCIKPKRHRPREHERRHHIACPDGMVAIDGTCVPGDGGGGIGVPRHFYRGFPGRRWYFRDQPGLR